MTSIVYDYKEIAKAARNISRSFDWYPNIAPRIGESTADEISFCAPPASGHRSWLCQPIKHAAKTKGPSA